MKATLLTPANDLEASVDFYRRLGFEIVSQDARVLVTDGRAVVEIDPDVYARPGVKLYKDSWTEQVRTLAESTLVTALDGGYLVGGPNGVRVHLSEGRLDVDLDREEASFGIPGNFHGVSLETTDMKRSLRFWEILGFSVDTGSIEAGWITLTGAEGLEVSLMGPLSCPHLFFNPSMTYFNGEENLEVIARLREAGIPITEEITHFSDDGTVDNVIIRDPGGLGFFIFND